MRRTHLSLLPLLALLAALTWTSAAEAQAPARHWAAGFRLGVFDMTNAPDSYDAVYGDPMLRAGGQVELTRGRLRFALSLDYGTVDGERVILSDPPRGTGVDQELTLTPLHLTAAWRFRPRARWDVYAGLGPSYLWWEDEGGGLSSSGSEVGGSVVVGLRNQGGGPWDYGGELRWSTFPDALPTDGGVTAFFDEDDPGGVSLTFLAVRRF